MKILVAGKSGQVATALDRAAPPPGLPDYRLVCMGRPHLDLGRPDTLAAAIAAEAPDILINAAAYTNVDKAEAEEDQARRINADGAAALARVAADRDIPFLHLSTDYVFDGTKADPYVEDDPVGPAGAYGRSKLDGERAVLAACPKAIVLRTAWVYSPWGHNFVRTMLRLGRERDALRVVGDQWGNPSYAPDIAAGLLGICARIAATGWQADYAGIFHLAGEGETSWHGLACEIFSVAAGHGHPPPEVAAITTEEYPTPAARPANSRLDTGKAARVFSVRLPHWRDGVADCVDRVLQAA